MHVSTLFLTNSLFLGVGLSMDAFSVSVVNGMNETGMNIKKASKIAGSFAFFQALMPMIGWIFAHSVVKRFSQLERYIPAAALILLSAIGIKMLIEGVKETDTKNENTAIGKTEIIIQGIATSIDALSAGFILAEYSLISSLVCTAIIAAVTFIVCRAGVATGKKAGTLLCGKANILGGIILILIGIEIFFKNTVCR